MRRKRHRRDREEEHDPEQPPERGGMVAVTVSEVDFVASAARRAPLHLMLGVVDLGHHHHHIPLGGIYPSCCRHAVQRCHTR